jgi:hypothetical protein
VSEYIIILVYNENLLGLQTRIHGYPSHHLGLPFAFPLIKGVVVFPVAFVGTLWALQYGLTSDIYYDEHDGEARETVRPKLI